MNEAQIALYKKLGELKREYELCYDNFKNFYKHGNIEAAKAALNKIAILREEIKRVNDQLQKVNSIKPRINKRKRKDK